MKAVRCCVRPLDLQKTTFDREFLGILRSKTNAGETNTGKTNTGETNTGETNTGETERRRDEHGRDATASAPQQPARFIRGW